MALEMDSRKSGPESPYVLSFGATPTAHVSNTLVKDKVYGELELWVYSRVTQERRLLPTDRYSQLQTRWKLLLLGFATSRYQPNKHT